MSVPSKTIGDIYHQLDLIVQHAKDLAASVPSEGDKLCSQIVERAEWVHRQLNEHIGSGAG